MADVYLNNKFLGTVENPKAFSKQIIDERRKGDLSSNLNVYYDEESHDIYIETSKGRTRRPLVVVKDGQPLLTEKHVQQLQKNEITWNDLVKQGIIENIDAAEEENIYIAFSEEELTKDHTHLDISPLAMMGLVTALVPYGNFTQAARLAIGSKNQKQAIGFYAANFPLRMDMDVNMLHEAQMPLVQTIMHEIFDYAKHPAGQNIVVAIMSYKGYNMEDAVVLNKGSIERGMGRSTYYRLAITEELRYAGGLTDEIGIPDKEIKGYKSERDYRLLEDDGIVYTEADVNENDVIVGKSSPPRFLTNLDEYNLNSNTRRESSVSMKHGESGKIDFVLLTESEEGNKLAQIRIREQKIPELGDKFTSRHGQKGVIGIIVPQSNMPFTSSGIVPDLIFSPHGIPSRMTVSHMVELVGGKVGALAGRYINGTAFDAESEDSLRKELETLGFRENGTETMYDPDSGEQLKAKIFIGNMYYLKLRHLVSNKLHSRGRGPIQLLTRQPTEGRAKEGGLRLGEMEKDTFVAHGASLLLKERFDSDKTIFPICENCGMIAVHNEYKNKSYCPVCGEDVEITNVEMSYAFKLMLDEFKSMGIYPKLTLEEKY